MRPAVLAVALLALPALAGCVSPEEPTVRPDDPRPREFVTHSNPNARWRYDAGAGALSTLALLDGPGTVDAMFVPGTLVLADGRLVPAGMHEAFPIARGGTLAFVPPPGLATVEVVLGAEPVTLATPPPAEGFVSGENVVRLLEVQRDRFPHRTPGHENYGKAQAYFADYFRALGYDVEVDPYGTMALDGVKAPVGFQPGPSSLANVVAFKRGTATPERFIVFGGHYDVVEGTVEGAFDNTAGSMAVLELARAFANVTTTHTFVFALWGGEEDGILGSRFWVDSNPATVAATALYVNLDVTGLAWPGPVPAPDPVLVTAAPDGPVSERLLALARSAKEDYARWPAEAEFLYQPWIVGGQVGGAGINAQSDHSSFASKGVPSYMFSTGDLDVVFALIHSPADTLANMTAYMATGRAPYEDPLSPEEEALGRATLARSFETQLWVPVYVTLLLDAGRASPGA